MDSALTTIGLPIALGIIMLGLGLDLTLTDFRPRDWCYAGSKSVLYLDPCFGVVAAVTWATYSA